MDFHEIILKGPIYIEELTDLPTWQPEFEKRLIYNLQDHSIYVGTDTGWQKIASGIINADYLNGFSADYFANNTLSNVDDGEILQKLSNVAGDGSGLDADFLDGHDSDYFINASSQTVQFATSGYVRFSSGLIIQWGRHSGWTTYFPITFPHACFMVTMADMAGESTDKMYSYISGIYTNRFTTISGYTHCWIAIGY